MKQVGNLPQIEHYAARLNQAFLNSLNHAIDVLEESAQQLPELPSIKFKSVIWIGPAVVDAQEIYIEVADNDLAISKYLTAPISAPLLVGITSHFIKKYSKISDNCRARKRKFKVFLATW